MNRVNLCEHWFPLLEISFRKIESPKLFFLLEFPAKNQKCLYYVNFISFFVSVRICDYSISLQVITFLSLVFPALLVIPSTASVDLQRVRHFYFHFYFMNLVNIFGLVVKLIIIGYISVLVLSLIHIQMCIRDRPKSRS